ncbi:MAG: copper amine oxidase N-terminal domain-containing protein [Bacillota bacterium]
MFLRTGQPVRSTPARRKKLTVPALGAIIFFIGGLLAAAPALAADALELEWEKTAGARLLDRGLFAIQTDDGGYIVVGETMSEGAYLHGNGGYDVYLIKLDAAGYIKWPKTFGGVGNDRGNRVQQTSDGGFIITGEIQVSSPHSNKKLYLLKTDASGAKQWEKTFGGSGEDTGACVRQTTDGGYIITGAATSFGAGQSDVYLIKTDENGKQEWDKTFGGKDDDYGVCVRQTSDGGFIAAGSTSSRSSAGGYDVCLIKTDAGGQTQWEKTFGGAGWDIPNTVEQTSDGGYIMAGRSSSFSQGDFDLYLVKTDARGNKQWEQTHGGSGWDTAKTIKQNQDGYLVAGWTSSTEDAEFAFLLLQTDANGNKLWQKTLAGEKYDERFSIQETEDNGYIVAGWWNERLKNQQWRNNDMQAYVAKLNVDAKTQTHVKPRPRAPENGILINDSPLGQDAPLFMKNGRIMAPYRAIAGALGAAVDWDATNQIVTLTSGDTKVIMKIGSTTALVNGQTEQLDAPAEIRSGRTYVPLRFISASLGAEVYWNSETKTASIVSGR